MHFMVFSDYSLRRNVTAFRIITKLTKEVLSYKGRIYINNWCNSMNANVIVYTLNFQESALFDTKIERMDSFDYIICFHE